MAVRSPATDPPLTPARAGETVPPAAGSRALARTAALLAVGAVGLQISYPLSGGGLRDALTVAVVAAFAAACLIHAAATRGPRGAFAVLLITAVAGFAVEVIGVHTGVPFGGYRYTASLGGQVLGVPVVVAFAWTMIAWPAAVAARRLAARHLTRIAVGAWALAAADLFLDPQMVAAGYWRWDDPVPHLPGVGTVPLTNLAGWLAVSLLMSAGLQRVLDTSPDPAPRADTLPELLFVWLWLGWSTALLIFLGLPAAAGWGFAGMGAVAVPLAARRLR